MAYERLHSSYLDQTDSDTASDNGACTTSMQLASRASDHEGKASTVTDTVDAWVGSEANDR